MSFLTVDLPHTLFWLAAIGAVGGPVVALWLWRRLGKGWVARAALAFGLIAYLCAVWGFLIEPRMLIVQHVTVVSDQWLGPPLRLGVVSDTHAGQPQISPQRIQRAMQRLNAEHPDLVVFLGDYAGGHAPATERSSANRAQVTQGAAGLGRAEAPLGRIGVLGNHDWWYDGPALLPVLEAAGIRMLENDAVRIERSGGPFWVAGLADMVSLRARPDAAVALRAVPAGEPVIVLTHWPDPFPQVPPRVALTLAGHTHCGQFRLPFIGAMVFPSEGSRRWNCGLYNDGGRKIYVSGGLGTSVIPARFGAPPEIAVVTLKAP